MSHASLVRVAAAGLQFGRLCRDGIYSVEYEVRVPVTLVFDNHHGRIVVEMPRTDDLAQTQLRLEAVDELVISSSGALFKLDYAARYSTGTVAGGHHFGRRRASSIDIAHAPTAPYTSHQIRILFDRGSEPAATVRTAFIAAARGMDILPAPRYDEVTTARRAVYAPAKLAQLRTWMSGASWPVAFQLEALVRSRLMEPGEVLEMRSRVEALVAQHGETIAAELLRALGQQLEAQQWARAAKRLASQQRASSIASSGSSPSARSTPVARFSSPPTKARSRLAKATPAELFIAVCDARRPGKKRRTNANSVEVFHATITPTGLTVSGPQSEASNRIVRKYGAAGLFLRLDFRDESGEPHREERGYDSAHLYSVHVERHLAHGVMLGGRDWSLLGWSMSSLKDTSVWMVAPFRFEGRRIDAETIRDELGTFSDTLRRQPARYAARVAQALSATSVSITIPPSSIVRMLDIETDGHVFTDGVSSISPDMAAAISKGLQCGRGRANQGPLDSSAFQFRLGDAKGMVAVDTSLVGMTMTLRPSQTKFESPTTDFEVASAFARPMAAQLNRPLVSLLSHLGVKTEVLLKLQARTIQSVKDSRSTLAGTAVMLRRSTLGGAFTVSSLFFSIDRVLGLQLSSRRGRGLFVSPFLSDCLDIAYHDTLCAFGRAIDSDKRSRQIKYKTRLPVAGSWTLVGVADEHGVLAPDEIFAQVDDVDGTVKVVRQLRRTMSCHALDRFSGTGARLTSSTVADYQLTGKVAVTRSPTTHPGDIRVLTAVASTAPHLRALKNVVVFSTRGQRSVPSMLGGGDLDGGKSHAAFGALTPADIYIVLTDPALIPPRTAPPAEYPAAVNQLQDQPTTVADMAAFFASYARNDCVGRIAIQHLRTADLRTRGWDDVDCLELSALHSAAVDLGKDDLPKYPHARADFMEKAMAGPHALVYTSPSALGQLFRACTIDAPPVVPIRPFRDVTVPLLDDATADTLSLQWADPLDPIDVALAPHLRKLGLPRPGDASALIDDVTAALDLYASERIIACSSISEEEVFIGTILPRARNARRIKTASNTMHEQAEVLVSHTRDALWSEHRGVGDRFAPVDLDRATPDQPDYATAAERTYAAYRVARAAGSTFGAQSFSFVALGLLLDVITRALAGHSRDLPISLDDD